jgi:hypothetical protein
VLSAFRRVGELVALALIMLRFVIEAIFFRAARTA